MFLINKYAGYGLLVTALLTLSGVSLYVWHYKPIKAMEKTIDKQDTIIDTQLVLIKLMEANKDVMNFEQNQSNELLKAKEKLYETNDVNLSIGTHTIRI